MPAKNSIKQYLPNSYYHLYNRGVEKRLIFLDKQDYSVFLSYLKEYLLPKDEKAFRNRLTDPTISSSEKDKILKKLRLNNFAGEVTLLAFCLMPNHFHFFVKQKSAQTIDKFMQSLSTRYTMYFNRKYKRVGSLFQAVYKAALVTSDEYFIHLSGYIHNQALSLQGETREPKEVQPTSYFEYIGKRHTEWVKPQEVLSHFSKNTPNLTYKQYILEAKNYQQKLSGILIDD